MSPVRVAKRLDECERLWREAFQENRLTDLWDVRLIFHRAFDRPLHFVAVEEEGKLKGFLPLSWLEEAHCYGYFPGETWHGRTWLEQNQIFCEDAETLERLLSACQPGYHIRYLRSLDFFPLSEQEVDEVGYLFLPKRYGFEMESYFAEFSSKTAKRLRRELEAFERRGATIRYGGLSDFDHLVRLNRERFGTYSYFHDARFEDAFRSLMGFLEDRGWLRMTTVLVADEIAAVDMGCVYRGVYTLLAGGTHEGFPGVAKFINMTHMKWACQEKIKEVDFLCGDFSWKTLFHLTPRPLYLLSHSGISMGTENWAQGSQKE